MTPLIALQAIGRAYQAGEQSIDVLKGIDLTVAAGEMLAIVGASGSGKSTLMNILGCLDRPTSGHFFLNGQDTAQMDADALAQLRREHFGFIFQRYHLLSDLSALGNVEMPAIYAGMPSAARQQHAASLLERLGLTPRIGYRPGQLSGGQQQRVSIARALMNGGEVILADEPTGALDSHSGQEVMAILQQLHAAGHTIIIVTHDMQVASYAERIVEMRDGEIISDQRQPQTREVLPAARAASTLTPAPTPGWRARLDLLRSAFHMSLLALAAHRLRSFLTMLGIIIGIASVVSVVALGEGSRQRILSDISSMGTNTIDVFPGQDFGDMKSARIETLVPDDADALAQQSYTDSVTPGVSSSGSTIRFGDVAVSATVTGVGEQYFRVRGLEMAEGQAFDQAAVARLAQDVVIDNNTKTKLFGAEGQALGQVIMLDRVPCRVIGVSKKKESGFGNNSSLNLWVPYTTMQRRLLGQRYLKSITVRVKDSVAPAAAEQGIIKLMTMRHRTVDFYVFNTDSIRQTIEKTTQTMTLLISMIALISLVVGGIGVMNIMLVSVTERTREIGVRMAVGARQSDIMTQFLIEAVLVCLAGGVLGIALALVIGWIFKASGGSFSMVYSPASIVAAFACSTLIGVLFGFLPAKNAAALDPVEALARE
jgi:macrolide transport system ATP-binding/permease protein